MLILRLFFCIFALIMKNQVLHWIHQTMKKHPMARHTGLAAICLGVIIIGIGFPLGWTHHNWILFLSLFLIIGGVTGHVTSMMHSPNRQNFTTDSNIVEDSDTNKQ